MKSRESAAKRKQAAGSVTVGRERFRKISAVEGVALSRAAKKRVVEFDRLGLPPRRAHPAHRRGPPQGVMPRECMRQVAILTVIRAPRFSSTALAFAANPN
jgi:hypothetical protein